MTHTSASSVLPADHPLATPSDLPYGLPDFSAVSDAQLAEAVRAGMTAQRAEVDQILGAATAPTFENTVRALELSGQLLRRSAAMFFTLVGSDGTDARQALAEELSPELAAHEDAILLDPRLASRVAAIDEGGLTGEDARLLETLRLRLSLRGRTWTRPRARSCAGSTRSWRPSRPPTRAASSRTPPPAPCSSRTASAWPV
ncbi:hypothetical protein [Micrococcus luteus]|uniref:hypothetical protein n=1 Tax=Micrococcus luteus TaxID=1270 RepID=UPI0003066C95